MGCKRISFAITLLVLSAILSCNSGAGRPSSNFVTPGPLAIAPNIIHGEGQILFIGGVFSHFIYGVNLSDFHPFDINASADGQNIDTLGIIKGLAVSPDGRFLFVAGMAGLTVYDILNPGASAVMSIDGDITSVVADPYAAGRAYITTWNGNIGEFRVIDTEAAGSLSITEKRIVFPNQIPAGVFFKGTDSIILLFSEPKALRMLDYANPISTVFTKEIPLSSEPGMANVVGGGETIYIVTTDAQLKKIDLNSGNEIVQNESFGYGELPLKLNGAPMGISLLPSAADYAERIAIADGMGFVDFYDSATGCPARSVSHNYKGFADAGNASNPEIQDFVLSPCNTKSEDWQVIYLGKIFDSQKNTGSVAAGSDLFVDLTADFPQLVNSGDRLSIATEEITGDYIISEVVDANTLRVSQAFSQAQDGIAYNIKGYPYLVKGSVSGIQRARATENVPYVSGKGEIQFNIISGDNPATEDDTFSITTSSERLKAAGLPYGIAVGSNNFVYVSNYSSNTISVINPSEFKVVDTLK